MGRRPGSQNADFAEQEAALLRAVMARLAEPDGARASFRELAAAAGVSTATLRHYFGDRRGVVSALLAYLHKQGSPWLLAVASGPLPPLRESLAWLLKLSLQGFREGLDKVHTIGLGAGLGEPVLGPAYVDEVLEPTLQAVEARLSRHIAAKHLPPVDVRHAALALVSPVVLAALHQGSLGGARCRPLDLEAFVDDHLDAFLRGWAAPAGKRSSS